MRRPLPILRLFAVVAALGLPIAALAETAPAECIGADDKDVLKPEILKERLKGPVRGPREIDVTATAIAFDASAMPPGITLKYAARLQATNDDGHFCCWSALWMADDGTEMKAISDNGKWLVAPIAERPDGTLADLKARIGDLRCDHQGRLLSEPGRREQDAAESMARLPDGRWLIAFECGAKCDGDDTGSRRNHGLRVYQSGEEADGQGLAGPPFQSKPLPSDFLRQPENLGPAGLTVLSGDRPLIFSENFYHRTGAECGSTKAWIAKKPWDSIASAADWEELRYPLSRMPSLAAEPKGPQTCYEVAGVAALPAGTDAFLLLERRFEAPDVMHLRLVVSSIAGLRSGHPPKPIFAWSEGGKSGRKRRLLDNFEGIVARPIEGGGIAIWILSDDNGDARWQKPCAAGTDDEPAGCQRTLLLRFDYAP